MTATRLNPQIAYEDVQVNVQVAASGGTAVVFSPTRCNERNYLFKKLTRAWPMQAWSGGAVCTVAYEAAWNTASLTTNYAQTYALTMRFFYLA